MSNVPGGFSDQTNNPYIAPQSSTPPLVNRRSLGPLPVFCMVVFIIELMFFGLRALLVLFAVGVGYAELQRQDDPMLKTAIYEIVTGACMAMFGISGCIVMLLKQGWGKFLAYMAMLATLGSMLVGVWQASFMIDKFAAGSPERIGGFIGTAFVLLLRVALLGLFVAAVLRFSVWYNDKRNATLGSQLV